jgi:hypothetical protein
VVDIDGCQLRVKCFDKGGLMEALIGEAVVPLSRHMPSLPLSWHRLIPLRILPSSISTTTDLKSSEASEPVASSTSVDAYVQLSVTHQTPSEAKMFNNTLMASLQERWDERQRLYRRVRAMQQFGADSTDEKDGAVVCVILLQSFLYMYVCVVCWISTDPKAPSRATKLHQTRYLF